MVTKDEESGKPVTVPKLILENDDDVRRFTEALVRKYMKNSFKEEMDRVQKDFDIQKEKSKTGGGEMYC